MHVETKIDSLIIAGDSTEGDNYALMHDGPKTFKRYAHTSLIFSIIRELCNTSGFATESFFKGETKCQENIINAKVMNVRFKHPIQYK